MDNNNYLDILKSRYFSTLCTAVGGIERAYILHRIHCWVMSNKNLEKKQAYAEGHYWMFSTLKQLHELEFPFMSERNFQRHIYALQDMGVLISDLHNRKKTSRKWYRINYDALNRLCEKTEHEINQSVSEDELPSFRQNDEYCEDGSRQNGEVRTPVLDKMTIVSRQIDENGPQTFAKMTNSFRQNDETIETNKENNYLYSFLSGSLSFLKSSFDEFLRNPDADIEEFESQLLECEKMFVNCRAESIEDHKALMKAGASLARMRRAIEERKKANRFDYDYDDQPEDYEEPTGQTAISLGDMIDKYGGLHVVG